MQFKLSGFQNSVEAYSSGVYLGLCHVDQVEELKHLEVSLRNSDVLCSALSDVMSRRDSRPLGGFAGERDAKAWMLRHRFFPCHVWFDAGRGLLWSPVAWGLVMRIARLKADRKVGAYMPRKRRA